jgi:hypothetical protein
MLLIENISSENKQSSNDTVFSIVCVTVDVIYCKNYIIKNTLVLNLCENNITLMKIITLTNEK